MNSSSFGDQPNVTDVLHTAGASLGEALRGMLNQTVSISAADAQPARRSGRHFPALDGVRGIAILMVMTFHLVGGGVSTNHAIRFLSDLVHGFGWAGVDLFFVLSGFLITGILLDSVDDPHYFRNFYARRTLRIFPLYYGVLAICFGILPFIHPFDTANLQWAKHNQLWLWLYGTNIREAWVGNPNFRRDWLWLTHLWSLAVEEHFYLVWPAAVLFCAPRKVLGHVCVIVAAAVLIARLIAMHAGVSDLTLYVLTPLRVDSMVIGGFVALLARKPGGMAALVKPAWGVFAASLMLIAALTVVGGFAHGQEGTARYFTPLALFFASGLILISVADPKANGAQGLAGRAIIHPVLRFLGRYSYGLYVLETLMQPLWDRIFRTNILDRWLHSYLLAGVAHLILCVSSTLALAMLSFHLFEKPFLQLKRFFEPSKVVTPRIPQPPKDTPVFKRAA